METPDISIEFFPPKTPEGAEKLRVARGKLAELQPKYFSVTFGAGGSTQSGTLSTVLEIQAEGHEGAPHLSCIGATRASIRAILKEFQDHGIRRVVALRGDLPSGYGGAGELRYASDLIEFIRAETGDWFRIEVAAYPEMHPQARSPQDDLDNFVCKIKAGANAAITLFLQSGRVFPIRRQRAQAGGGRADRAGHHADHELHATHAIFRHVRRRDSTLDPPQAGQLRRRYGIDQGVWPGCRVQLVRTPAGRRRAGLALLQHEPGRTHDGHLAAPARQLTLTPPRAPMPARPGRAGIFFPRVR